MRLQRRRLASNPGSTGQGMEVKLNKQAAMHWSFVLKDDPKVTHRCKKGRAGEHEITPGGLQAGGGDASGLVGRLAKSVGNSA